MAPASTDDTAIIAVEAAITPASEDAQAIRDEEALNKRWQERIKRGRRLDKDEREKLERWRRYAAGEPQKGEREWLVDTNLVEATIEGLLPSIYARDPDISVTPSEAVGETHYAVVRQFARTVQVVVRRLLWDAKFKRRMQRAVRAVFPASIGVLKVTMQMDSERDPEIDRRINSLTDNLRRIDYLMRDMADSQDVNPQLLEAQRAELEAQMAALQEQVEVMVARGIVIDVMPIDDVQVDDELRELADYAHGNWIALRTWYTPERAMEQFGLSKEQLRGATSYSSKSDTGKEGEGESYAGDEAKECAGWLACWEIWDKQSSTVYTMIDGLKRWVRPPFPPKPAGQRFYPVFFLGFHWQENRRWPLAPISMWHKLQDEYARTRSGYSQHRKTAVPARVADKDSFSPEDAKKLNNPAINEVVLVERMDKSRPLKDELATLDYPKVDPGLYDTGAIRADLEQVSGLSDAGRSAVVKPKTATEAAIVANGGAGRSSLKQDEVEDLVEEIACYVAELALQSMTLQDAQKYAGPDAVWPRLSLEQIHTLLDINVRAGTSGKPNEQMEQQTWTMLAPQAWQGLTQIYQSRSAGQFELADALTKLLELTLDKFDVKVDINELVPKMQPGQAMGAIAIAAGAPPGLPPGVPAEAMPPQQQAANPFPPHAPIPAGLAGLQ